MPRQKDEMTRYGGKPDPWILTPDSWLYVNGDTNKGITLTSPPG